MLISLGKKNISKDIKSSFRSVNRELECETNWLVKSGFTKEIAQIIGFGKLIGETSFALNPESESIANLLSPKIYETCSIT
jgi:hypothetical protein